MRRNKVLLSSLGVGRCFTLPKEPGDDPVADETAKSATLATPVLGADAAWKVSDDGDEVRCVSAKGEEKAFSGETLVVEIPRQGYDKLAGR